MHNGRIFCIRLNGTHNRHKQTHSVQFAPFDPIQFQLNQYDFYVFILVLFTIDTPSALYTVHRAAQNEKFNAPLYDFVDVVTRLSYIRWWQIHQIHIIQFSDPCGHIRWLRELMLNAQSFTYFFPPCFSLFRALLSSSSHRQWLRNFRFNVRNRGILKKRVEIFKRTEYEAKKKRIWMNETR